MLYTRSRVPNRPSAPFSFPARRWWNREPNEPCNQWPS